METFNPEGKVVERLILDRDHTLVKEECACWGNGRVHWNLLITDPEGEVLVETFRVEKDVDWVIFVFKAWLSVTE